MCWIGRGTLDAPGRTVTLEACKDGVVFGAAYLLAGTREEQQSTLKVQSCVLKLYSTAITQNQRAYQVWPFAHESPHPCG